MNGFVNLYKPRGPTSHDMVQKMRRLLGIKKVGHTGTLDPEADGVLLVACGKATRLIEFLEDHDKRYVAEIIFGISTDTGDIHGQKIQETAVCGDDLVQFPSLLNNFTGEIEQLPPMYSAVSVNGQRLYRLAREGKVVDRPSRTVRVYETRLLDAPQEKGEGLYSSRFEIFCSRGTYIRSYCSDLGKKLGLPATMGKLTRTAVGRHVIEHAWTLDEIDFSLRKNDFSFLIPLEKGVSHLPAIKVAPEIEKKICNGRAIRPDECLACPEAGLSGELPIAVFSEKGSLLAIAYCEQSHFGMRKVFCN